MASLYLAHRTGPEGFARPVALKVIHPHLSQDPQFVRMFVDEALLCARIRHPNVVHVEELGQHGGAYYLAMEYVDGCSLGEVLDRLASNGELMDPRISVSIACSLLEGLHATHNVKGDAGEALEVVHRDVSPSNILIDRTGHVKLIDFGIAKARGRAVETSAGMLKGKYAYMSPEQAWGRDIDRRTDLYAASVVLWEMLATRPLFSADSELGLLELARSSDIPRLSSFLPSIPEALAQAVAWGLAADRNARPDTARALRKALLEAMPEAREVDVSEIAELVTRTSGIPSRPPAPTPKHVTGDLMGPTLASTPLLHDPKFAPAAGQGERSTQAAATSVSKPHRHRLWLALGLGIALTLLLGTMLWKRPETKSETRSLPIAAPPVLPETPPVPSAAPSLAEPPHEVPAEEAKGVQQPVPERPRGERPARTKRSHGATKKSGDSARRKAGPTSIDGVPIVDQPSF